jgi:hypothetical protein
MTHHPDVQVSQSSAVSDNRQVTAMDGIFGTHSRRGWRPSVTDAMTGKVESVERHLGAPATG